MVSSPAANIILNMVEQLIDSVEAAGDGLTILLVLGSVNELRSIQNLIRLTIRFKIAWVV